MRIILACLLIALASCAPYPNQPPPIPPVETERVPAPPVSRITLIWQPGHYDWVSGEYIWVHGEWVPREGHGPLWQDGFWRRSGPGYVWQPAHWIR